MSKLKSTLDQLRTYNGVFVNVLKSNVKANVEEVSKNMQKAQKEIIYRKAGELNSWYTRVLGLDEVKKYQERVADLQVKLLDAQERRRDLGYQLSEIRTESNAVQDQIHKVNRQEAFEKFLDLMRKETEILQREREIAKQFNHCDQEEREIFTAYTNSVKDSHEKQRAQLEYTKYFGLILSLVGSFLTFCYSTLKKQDLKHFVEKQLIIATGSSQDVVSRLKETEMHLNNLKQLIVTAGPSQDILGRLKENETLLIDLVQHIKNNVDHRPGEMDNISHNSKLDLSSNSSPESANMFYSFLETNKRIIIGSIVLCVVLKAIG